MELTYYFSGWRDETYSVFKDGFRSEILFDIERAAVGIIGCEYILNFNFGPVPHL